MPPIQNLALIGGSIVTYFLLTDRAHMKRVHRILLDDYDRLTVAHRELLAAQRKLEASQLVLKRGAQEDMLAGGIAGAVVGAAAAGVVVAAASFLR